MGQLLLITSVLVSAVSIYSGNQSSGASRTHQGQMNHIEAIELVQCQDCPPFSIYGDEVQLFTEKPFRVAFEVPPSFRGNFLAEIQRVGPGGEYLELLYESASFSILPGANFITVQAGVTENEGFLFLQLTPLDHDRGEDLRYFARLGLSSTNIGNGIGDGAGDELPLPRGSRLENALRQPVDNCGLESRTSEGGLVLWLLVTALFMALGLRRRFHG